MDVQESLPASSETETADAGLGVGHREDSAMLSVRFRSENISIPYTSEDKVGDIKEKLAAVTGVLPEFMKLVVKGRMLADGGALLTAVWAGDKAGRINMIGSKAEELMPSSPPEGLERVKDDLTGAGRAASLSRRGDLKASRGKSTEFSFGRIEALESFSDKYKAEELLRSLANDQAILSVLAKHKWKVGALCEMFPEGYVGVSNVCVMGLNQNHGEKILLRLRTDDLKGFRKILSIRKVLFHELAHNVHSEHDDNFYMLMRQIEREVNEADWTTNGKGRMLDNGYERHSQGPSTGEAAVGAEQVAFRLGGDESRARQGPRYAAALAALERHSAEEKEVEEGCGHNRSSSNSK